MLNDRIRDDTTPTNTAGNTGTRRVFDTDDHRCPIGRLLSRPMANRMRTDMAWMARQQTKIARAQSATKSLPQVLPSTSVVMAVRLSDVGVLYKASLTAIVPKRISRKPRVPAVASACRIAFGAFDLGSSVSSASEPAESNP